MSEETAKTELCFWCGLRPGTPAKPGKIALCPDCLAELAPKEGLPLLQPEALEA